VKVVLYHTDSEDELEVPSSPRGVALEHVQSWPSGIHQIRDIASRAVLARQVVGVNQKLLWFPLWPDCPAGKSYDLVFFHP
jgi:hypothetical protein